MKNVGQEPNWRRLNSEYHMTLSHSQLREQVIHLNPSLSLTPNHMATSDPPLLILLLPDQADVKADLSPLKGSNDHSLRRLEQWL